MSYPTRAIIAVVLGTGLIAAAQAQNTYSQSTEPANRSAAPAQAMQNAARATPTHRAVRGPAHRISAVSHKTTRQQVRLAQQELKSDGLYRGRIDGMMNRQMRLAIARFQKQNGLPRTAALDRNTLDRLKGGQRGMNGLGVGSSTPVNPNAMNSPSPSLTPVTPPTNPATTGAGGSTAPNTAPSSTGTTSAPNNPTTKY